MGPDYPPAPRVGALSVACPKCGAGQHEKCVSRTGRPGESHSARYLTAKRAGVFGGTDAATEANPWADLREEIQHLRTAAYDVATEFSDEGMDASRVFGRVEAFDQVLALMAHTGTEG